MAKRDGCPICGRATELEFKPFCSRGCKDRDLLRWLGESQHAAEFVDAAVAVARRELPVVEREMVG